METAPSRISILRPLIFVLLVAGIISVVYGFHLQQYLEKERLRLWIAGYGAWGPFIFLLVWFLAPPLLLPCLPITLAGGILFGPFWGVVYTSIGSTIGATLAFLVARYLARDWVAHRIAGTRLARLDTLVARKGWEIVAFSRMLTIPFSATSYAFGLTRVSLPGYMLATFFGLMPMTIAFVYFSANFLELLQGKVTWGLVVGLILVGTVSLIPFAYRRVKAKRGEQPEL